MHTPSISLTLLIAAQMLGGCADQSSAPPPPAPRPSNPSVAPADTPDSAEAPQKEPEATPAASPTAVAAAVAEPTPAGPAEPPPASPQGEPAWDAAGQLPPAARARLEAISGDVLGRVKIHYIATNETRYDLWFPHIAGRGGVYLGVGPDQNYSLAAVAGAELVILMDYDAVVLDLHRFYLGLVRACERPEQLLELWQPKRRKAALAALAKHYDPETVKRLAPIHRYGRRVIKRHATRHARPRDEGGRTWLSDPALYARWRALVRQDRVLVVAGDLTAGGALREVGRALDELGARVQLVYFSNAEEFWPYPDAFRAAVQALPLGPDALVLRTIVLGEEYRIGWRFHYTLQRVEDFVAWLRRPGPLEVQDIVAARVPIDGKPYFSRLPPPP